MQSLAGHLVAFPGQGLPALHSTRRALAGRLARGRPASVVPDLLGHAFALCGGAHRWAARAAIEAAQGHPAPAHSLDEDGRLLQIDTIREHLRRITLDWADALDASETLPILRCPLMVGAMPSPQALADGLRWIEDEVFGMPVPDWLAHWCDDAEQWLTEWAARQLTPVSRLMHRCRTVARSLRCAPAPLLVHGCQHELTLLAHQIAEDERFSLQPLWRGRCAETGPWTRLNDREAKKPTESLDAWQRMGARLADLARLAAPDQPDHAGTGWLRRGQLKLAPGQGMAWCEMARGLLVHWTRLDPADAQRVADHRVVAPTEWNFHSHGSVSRLLGALPRRTGADTVRLLGAAFDPCVTLQLAPSQAAATQPAGLGGGAAEAGDAPVLDPTGAALAARRPPPSTTSRPDNA